MIMNVISPYLNLYKTKYASNKLDIKRNFLALIIGKMRILVKALKIMNEIRKYKEG